MWMDKCEIEVWMEVVFLHYGYYITNYNQLCMDVEDFNGNRSLNGSGYLNRSLNGSLISMGRISMEPYNFNVIDKYCILLYGIMVIKFEMWMDK